MRYGDYFLNSFYKKIVHWNPASADLILSRRLVI
jgi:hypothetical protein